MDEVLIGFIVYLVVMLGIGAWSSKDNSNNEDWLLGGRKINGYLLAFSERASGESAWLVLGLPAAALMVGIGELYTAVGSMIGIIVSWVFVAKPLRNETLKFGALTIPQYLSSRFGDCKVVLLLSSLVTIFFYITYIASGFGAAGTMFEATFGIDKNTGMLLGAGVVGLYTMIGGFTAVVITDMVQALLMVAALTILPAVGIYKMGGIAVFLDKLSLIEDPTYLSLNNGNMGIAAVTFALAGLSWGFGYLGQPHLLTRYMAMPSDDDIKKGKIVAFTWIGPAFLGAILLGLVAKVTFSQEILVAAKILGEGGNSDGLMPFFAKNMVPMLLAGVLISGAIAAMMSTADTQLLVITSAVTEDLYHRFMGKAPGEKQLLMLSRAITIVVCVLALALAFQWREGVMAMVSYAWGGLGSTFGPIIVLSLYSAKTNRNGVIAGLLFGSIGTIVWKLQLQHIVPERFSIFVLNFVVIYVVSLLTAKKEQSA
ncbi:MAG: sodium/proline symporter [Candidatus Cloacimonetes bacterium]|nr:sodium/proline symporter [Candidatus Cloacimonadota bacterium]